MSPKTRLAHVAGILAGALAATAALAQGAPDWRPLAGEWKINKSLSDAKPSREGADGERPPMRGGGPPSRGGGESGGAGGGFGPGGPGGNGGPGGQGGPPGGPGEGRPPGERPPALGGFKSVLIAVDETNLRLSADGGTVRTLVPGGEPVERTRGQRTVTETVAWEGRTLLVRSSSPDGRTMTESLFLGEDGRLVHSVTLPGREPGEERSLTWVYDRVGEAAGQPKK